jgi:curli biogenesis system outer membrane secretion channel CsgG
MVVRFQQTQFFIVRAKDQMNVMRNGQELQGATPQKFNQQLNKSIQMAQMFI